MCGLSQYLGNPQVELGRVQKLSLYLRNDKQHLTDIQILMLGGIHVGKTSTGNLIIGKEVFKVKVSGKTTWRNTMSCTVGQAEVHDRQLTVVDTPGWHYNHSLEKTPEIDKLEIRRSVYLCPPGPHVILLIVSVVTAFNRHVRRGVEEHMSLLGKNVWSHTIVLFTWGDWLGDTTIEERIEAEGEHLQWLLEQCGYRYHVFNCKLHTDSTQVTELLEKIEEMVMENNGLPFVPPMNENPFTEYNLKMKTAKTNMMKVMRQRDIFQELLKERKYNLSNVRIVLFGEKGAGKSTSGNNILHGYFFDQKGYQISDTHPFTRQCVLKQKQIGGCQISVVDTPGWSTSTVENAKEILRSVTVCSPGPHAFLLVLPVYKPFTKQNQEAVTDLMRLFGENVWRHTIILFNTGYCQIYRPVEEYIACEGEALQELVRKCGNRYHVIENDWSNRSQITNLLKMIELMVAKNRGEYFTLEKKENKPTSAALKTLTEEEWMKREDELIDRVLKAVVVDLEEESRQPTHRRESFNGAIPSMSGDSGFSDVNSLYGVDALNSAFKVSQWLRHPGYEATSPAYDTMSTVSSSRYQKMENVKDDIPVPKHPADDMKSVSNMQIK
ncbi:GTPase IMAP family member 8 [Paramisgurnus dabryanus]|uniref:GTPase IMAP family member 8 n=1 Tax=Paramisgurnus dabryanus TaxID=90735 RepID=UPI003CCFB995